MRILEEMTDEELAMLYIDGNNKAFDLLLSRNQSKIFSYIVLLYAIKKQQTTFSKKPS